MSTESGNVSLEEELVYCLPLALFDRTKTSLVTDFCKESEIFVIQYSQVYREEMESKLSWLVQITCTIVYGIRYVVYSI